MVQVRSQSVYYKEVLDVRKVLPDMVPESLTMPVDFLMFLSKAVLRIQRSFHNILFPKQRHPHAGCFQHRDWNRSL